MRGYGWCLLRAEIPESTEFFDKEMADRLDEANKALWREFEHWMSEHPSPWLLWQFHEYHNNDSGVLTFSVSRNHRSGVVWDMLAWIAERAPGSYGLFYAHDDEDSREVTHYGRGHEDFSNVFRVHRLLRGELTELADPFFGDLSPTIEPW